VCGAGIKQARGWTWLDWHGFAGDHDGCTDRFICPICQPKEGEIMGLVWVGKRYYTPESFTKEAVSMGVSKRIAATPKKLVLGKTRVLVAHPEACISEQIPTPITGEVVRTPGIFFSFVAQRIEKIVAKSELEDEEAMEQLRKRGITPIVEEQETLEEKKNE